MAKILSDGACQWFDDSFVHDSGDESECSSSDILVVSDEIVPE